MADPANGVYDGPVGQLTVVPLSNPIKNRTMGHVALFGLDGLPYVGGRRDITSEVVYDSSKSYKKGDYVIGSGANDPDGVGIWLAAEDIEPGNSPGPDSNESWKLLGVSLNVLGLMGETLASKADLPIKISDLGFDPADQAELDSAVAAAVSSLTQEINARVKTSDYNTAKTAQDNQIAANKTASDTNTVEVAKRQLIKPKLYLASGGQIEHIATFGHSLTALGGPVDRPSARLSSYLTGIADDTFYGVSGSDLLSGLPAASSGWGRVFNEFHMKDAAFNPPDLIFHWSGMNGLSAFIDSFSTAGKSADMCREAMFSYARAKPGTLQDKLGNRFTFSGGWAAAEKSEACANIDFNYGIETAYVDETFTIDEGGTHAICFLEHATYGGCKWEIKEGNTVLGVVDNTNNATLTNWAPVVFRVKNLKPGSTHTYRITMLKAGANVPFGFFYGSWNESATPPVILDCLQYLPIPEGLAAYTGSAHIPTPADVAFLNERIRANAGLFDDYVQTVDTPAVLDNRPGFLLADYLHLAASGGKAVAMKALQTLLYRCPVSQFPID